MAISTIYFIRHGQTDWNAELRYQGRQDIELNANGRRQANDNGRKLRSLLDPEQRLRFISSPMLRARQTMAIVLEVLGLPERDFETRDWLIEASYGELEGMTLSEFKARDPQLHRERKVGRWNFRPPGGESHEMVAQRVSPMIETLPDPAIVVAHGVVGRVMRQFLLDLDPDEAANFVFPQDAVFIWRDGREKRI